MKRILYIKQFSRDYCLALCDMWCRAESILPKVWTKRKQPKYPYIVFVRGSDGVECFMDESGIDFLKKELLKSAIKDKQFCKKVATNFSKTESAVNEFIKNKKILTKSELKKLMNLLEKFWVWFEAIWWLIVAIEEKGLEKEFDFKLLLKVRKQGERTSGGNVDAVIEQSIKVIFPEISQFSKVISAIEIKTNNIPAKSVLAKRMNGYYCTPRKIFVSKKELYQSFNISLESEKMAVVSEIKGSVAYPGTVRSVVRKVFGKDDLSKVGAGEILVSPMTLPIFIQAMEIAGAIVTDEGGIICHAAIVARELKKPCIIGTKIATKVLKDGDLVEVDANTGTVTILKKADEN